MADIQSIQRKLPRIEDEVRQYFLHNSFELEKETIKAIKQTINNIVKHAITAKFENELVKDLVLLEKLFYIIDLMKAISLLLSVMLNLIWRWTSKKSLK